MMHLIAKENEAKLLEKLNELANDLEVDMYSVANLNFFFEESANTIRKLIEEIQQYRAIGTVEEFKALKELNTPYKPQEYEDRYYACKCGNTLLHKWRKYPTELMPKSKGLPHCLACGQKLDWE